MDCKPYGVSGKPAPADPQQIENAWKQAAPRTGLRNGVKPTNATPADAKERVNCRKAALERSEAIFNAPCGVHGITVFDTATGACLSCVAEKAQLPPRLAYGSSYGVAYPKPCAVHGDAALAYYPTDRCTACFDTYGRRRKGRAGNPARHAARAAGATTYRATCAVHGETDFHTVRGKCLDCFNSLGYPRKVPR